MRGAEPPSPLSFGGGDQGRGETAPGFGRDSQTSLLHLLGCTLVSQEHHEHSCFFAVKGCMEAEEFHVPAVLLFYFTSVAVTVHVTAFSDVKVSNSVSSKRALYQSAIEAGTAWL